MASAAQLIRIARLRRFVGVFARGGDVESAAEALLELSRTSRASGYHGESLKRARQAAELLAQADDSPVGVRALLRLCSMLLATDVDAAIAAADVARERADALAEAARSELLGVAALLGGVAHAMNGSDEEARARLHDSRELLIAAGHPEGAALALTQLGLLDAETGRWEAAAVCLRFAREFYVVAENAAAAAEVAALAARTLAAEGLPEADAWFRTAIADADLAGSHVLAAELAVEHAEYLERAGAPAEAATAASQAARRCAVLDPAVARPLSLRARMQLARLSEVAPEALRHVEAAFELALDLRDPAALGAALEVVVIGLVERRYGLAGWRVVDRCRQRLVTAGFTELAEAATAALGQLYPLVVDEMTREEEARAEPPQRERNQV